MTSFLVAGGRFPTTTMPPGGSTLHTVNNVGDRYSYLGLLLAVGSVRQVPEAGVDLFWVCALESVAR